MKKSTSHGSKKGHEPKASIITDEKKNSQFSDEDIGLSSSARERRRGLKNQKRRLEAAAQLDESSGGNTSLSRRAAHQNRAVASLKQRREKSSLQHDEEGVAPRRRGAPIVDEDNTSNKQQSLELHSDEELKTEDTMYSPDYYTPASTAKMQQNDQDSEQQDSLAFSANPRHLVVENTNQTSGAKVLFPSWNRRRQSQQHLLADRSESSLSIVESTPSITTAPQPGDEQTTTLVRAIPVNEHELEVEFERRILERSVPAQVVSFRGRKHPRPPTRWFLFWVLAAIILIGGLIVGLSVGLAPSSSSQPQESDACQGDGELDVVLQCECFGEVQPASEPMLQDSYVMMRQSLQGQLNQSESFDAADNNISYTCSAENLALWWVATDMMDHTIQQEVDLDDELLFQRYALVTLFLATGGKDWNEQGQWLTPENECNWASVGCNSQGSVTQLALSKQNLNGTVPQSLTRLTSLLDIALNDNFLRGSFPDLSNLILLENIDVSHNQLEGSLPSLLDFNDFVEAALKVLESGSNISLLDIYLDNSVIDFDRRHANVKFSHNSFSGEMPLDQGIGSTMREYRIDNNRINGSFGLDFIVSLPPTFWQYLSSLTPADFDTVNRSPTFIFDEVEVLDISNNQFTGSLPEFVQLLPDLEYLNVSFNRFQSTVPAGIRAWEEIESIDASYNMLHGTIPKELATLPQLRELYLSGNDFTGTFPSELCSFSPFLFPPRLNCTAVTGCTCCRCD